MQTNCAKRRLPSGRPWPGRVLGRFINDTWPAPAGPLYRPIRARFLGPGWVLGQTPIVWLGHTSVKTLRTQDTSDPRHFGTRSEVSIRHFGTSAELSGHFGTSAEMSWDTSALRKIIWHCAPRWT